MAPRCFSGLLYGNRPFWVLEISLDLGFSSTCNRAGLFDLAVSSNDWDEFNNLRYCSSCLSIREPCDVPHQLPKTRRDGIISYVSNICFTFMDFLSHFFRTSSSHKVFVDFSWSQVLDPEFHAYTIRDAGSNSSEPANNSALGRGFCDRAFKSWDYLHLEKTIGGCRAGLWGRTTTFFKGKMYCIRFWPFILFTFKVGGSEHSLEAVWPVMMPITTTAIASAKTCWHHRSRKHSIFVPCSKTDLSNEWFGWCFRISKVTSTSITMTTFTITSSLPAIVLWLHSFLRSRNLMRALRAWAFPKLAESCWSKMKSLLVRLVCNNFGHQEPKSLARHPRNLGWQSFQRFCRSESLKKGFWTFVAFNIVSCDTFANFASRGNTSSTSATITSEAQISVAHTLVTIGVHSSLFQYLPIKSLHFFDEFSA